MIGHLRILHQQILNPVEKCQHFLEILGTKAKKTDVASSKSLNAKKVESSDLIHDNSGVFVLCRLLRIWNVGQRL